MRYILYARKSSESEDRQVQSISDQLRVLREFAAIHDLTIVEEITESKSAKAPGDRPGFARMLDLIKKGRADGILCWAINRLTRNPVDSGTLSWMLQNGELQIIQTPEKQYLPTDNVLILSVETGTANQFILDLKRNVKRGIDTKLMLGWYPHRAPEGYRNDRNTHTIVADDERFALLQRAWRLLIDGTHTPAKVIQILNDEWGYRTRTTQGADGLTRGGTKLSRSNGYNIFTNLFYTGYFRHGGQVYKGSHQPMITLAEFEAVQARLRSQGGLAHYQRHDFPYKGLIHCGRCGNVITAEVQAGRHRRGKWVYYHCNNVGGSCSKRSIREDVLEQQIAGCLRSIRITPEVKDLVLSSLERWIREEFEAQETACRQQARALAEAEAMLNELLDMRLRQQIPDQVYQAKRHELDERVSGLRLATARTEEQLAHTRETIERALDFQIGAEAQWTAGKPEKRRAIAQALAKSYRFTDGELDIELNPLLLPMQRTKATVIEPLRPGSGIAKRTLSDERVHLGWTDGTLIEPLASMFRAVSEGNLTFFFPS